MDEVLHKVNLKQGKHRVISIALSALIVLPPLLTIFAVNYSSEDIFAGIALIFGMSFYFLIILFHEYLHYWPAKRFGFNPQICIQPNVSTPELIAPTQFIIICLLPMTLLLIPITIYIMTKFKFLALIMGAFILSGGVGDLIMAWETFRLKTHGVLVRDNGADIEFIKKI